MTTASATGSSARTASCASAWSDWSASSASAMDDELARWAQSRAPDLIARAEAQAVAILRDALVEAARRPAPASQPPTRAPAQPPTGELMWAYCVLRTDDPVSVDVPGVDGAAVEPVAAGGLTALVSRVPAAQFAS